MNLYMYSDIGKQNEKILQQNTELLQKFSALNIQLPKLTDTLYEPLVGFPLSTVIEFEEMDKKSNKALKFFEVVLKSFKGLKSGVHPNLVVSHIF